MYLNSDYIPPQELTGYARETLANLPQNQFGLSAFLPNRPIDDLEYRFTKGGEGLAEAATFRSYDAESGIGKRPGVSRVSGELPPISRKIRLGEYDRLRQRKANDRIVDGLFSDSERMTRAVAARIELARGEALNNGSLTINENGIVATVSFGREGSHSTSAGTLWSSHSTATPIADLLSWIKTYVATNDGVRPGAVIMSTEAFQNAAMCTEVRNLGSVGAMVPSIISLASFTAMLSAYGIPPVVIYDAQVSVNGSATRVIPEKAVILAPEPSDDPENSPLGATLWGTTAESLEPGYNLSGDEPGIVAGVYSTNDPVALWTKAAAIALPVLANPNLTLRANVLA